MPFATVIALKLHVGAGLVPGRILLQLSTTVDGSSPPDVVMVTIELLDPPAATEEGERAEAARTKATAGFTTWAAETVCFW
jgi:hypothetical protein